ncbi:GMC family oxidoreductase [Thermoactinospora rubra]|uniref:GMC family oxidoreductase n=1 Tax=Thermoactinospora rubra TaxID=1088767 RepID=UPI000A0F82EF|nr:GMC family oxidoreductase [Thermoactinospora rubra]
MDTALITLNPYEARIAAAVFDRLFPADENSPAASAIGVVTYVDRALSGAYHDHADTYRLGLRALDRAARARHGTPFARCGGEEQDGLLADMEHGRLPGFHVPPQAEFFDLLRLHLQEGLFADPAHGGNRDKLGWRFLGHPGIWFEHTAEDHLAEEPVDRGGEIRSLADAGWSATDDREPLEIPGYDPQRSVLPPDGPTDVVLVGLGAVGGFVAPILARAGLKVVALEAGPYRTKHDYVPDEVGATYYCRGDMGPKYLSETPRWRRDAGEPTRPATFSLGRMMNGVGGSVVHWGGALRRMHPHHFRFLSHVREAYGTGVLPEHHALADWPIGYEELEPYYTVVEYIAGVAGDESNPFVARSKPYPMPPLRTFRLAEVFREATQDMGLHPYPTPVCMNSVPYNGLPATTYHPWSAGFGSFFNERWNPGLTSVPDALATGNLDLRTHCRVLRVLTDRDGHADGVEYVDANGTRHVQRARAVILCGYTFENVRLLLLSRDDRHPGGLGNNTGQVGKYFMTKLWDDVFGYFPDVVFNGHTGPAAQMWSLDDFNAASFDSAAHGFVGGATYNVENQRLPIQVSRDPVPDGVRRWGKPYKDHIRRWQHVAALRIQPDSLPYHTDFLDLDPDHRDRSGLGLPVVRITADLRPNENRLLAWMEAKGEEILRAMGAAKTWRGTRFRGVCSSHDLGGARMGEDPRASVVDPTLRVHDTPGLYVFGGAVFPTCHGVNPQLTIWALTMRAAEQLVKRLQQGEER